MNDMLSSIPPYALYHSGTRIKSSDHSKQLYVDRYSGRHTDILCRAKEAWLFDMHITHNEYTFLPRAIQIELDHCDPKGGVDISQRSVTIRREICPIRAEISTHKHGEKLYISYLYD